jgi:hypothetical protein
LLSLKTNTTMKGSSMLILHDILEKLRSQFEGSRKAGERGIWFVYTIVAIIIPFTSSKTSNILRCLNTLFGFTGIAKKRFYTFMASPKIPWNRLWPTLYPGALDRRQAAALTYL